MYDSMNYLHFDKYIGRERIDTALFSFTHYPALDEVTHYFKVSLIGKTLNEDKEYEVTVLSGNDLKDIPYTTAKEGQYTFPEKLIFRKGVLSDSLAITVLKNSVPEGEEYYMTVRLKANDNFGVGYYQNTDVRLKFNNIPSTPLWWDNGITRGYFGVYSKKKLETIMLANPGFTTTEGMSSTDKTKIGIITNAYILEHNVTEENGDPMVLPIY